MAISCARSMLLSLSVCRLGRSVPGELMAERPLPAYDGDEPYVFVSYSHEDSDLVYPGIRWLQDQRFNIWYDEDISPGHNLVSAISASIQCRPAPTPSISCRASKLLGTSDSKKQHILFDGGQYDIPRTEVIRTAADWLDQNLGVP